MFQSPINQGSTNSFPLVLRMNSQYFQIPHLVNCARSQKFLHTILLRFAKLLPSTLIVPKGWKQPILQSVFILNPFTIDNFPQRLTPPKFAGHLPGCDTSDFTVYDGTDYYSLGVVFAVLVISNLFVQSQWGNLFDRVGYSEFGRCCPPLRYSEIRECKTVDCCRLREDV